MTDDELRSAYEAGTPVAALAEQCGVTVGTMKNRLSAIGARRPVVRRSEVERVLSRPAAQAIRAELAHGPATSRALADRLAYSLGTVRLTLHYLHRAGLVRRVGPTHWRIG